MIPTIDDVFGEKGILASSLDNYEMRPGQVELSRAIQRSIGEGRSLVAEGPTGCGKSFAYILPILLELPKDLKRGVIATANIALQEQLIEKDLPALERMMPIPFNFALLKGRSNYVCRDKMVGFVRAKELMLTSDDSYVADWYMNTTTGDKSELSIEYSKWSLISSGPGECLGGACGFGGTCFANTARRAAERSQIIVTNYHVLLAGGGVPTHDVLVCDEAHDLEDIARSAIGWKISTWMLERVAAWVQRNQPEDWNLGNKLFAVSKNVFDDVKLLLENRDTMRLLEPDWSEPVEEIVQVLIRCSKLAQYVANETMDKAKKVRAENTDKKINELINQFIQARDVNDGYDWVCWLSKERERSKSSVHINGAPIMVNELLPELLYSEPKSTILISATMTSGNSFEFIRSQLGVPENAGEIIAPSPFDLKRQGIIVVPSDVPPPNVYSQRDAQVFYDAVAESATKLILICHGKCLLLFTSWKSLTAVHERLIQNINLNEFRIMRQGEAPRTQLVDEFKHDVNSVLLGVSSFWQGIDIPGEALTGLLIDKIPFPVPTDPVQVAVNQHIEKSGGNPFMQRAVPQATIALSQGIGRLIRTKQDRGIAVIMDNRLVEKGYGSKIVRSLPGLSKVRSFSAAMKFMAK